MSKTHFLLIFRRNFGAPLHHGIKKARYLPAASEVPLYRNVFDRADHPSLWEKDATRFVREKPTQSLDDLLVPSGHGHVFINTSDTHYAHYVNVWEPVFPRTPDVSKGELISGANFTRSSGWHFPGVPAVVSVGKLGPDNQRPAGYAENASVPDSMNPEAFPDFREYRLPGGVDRRPAFYLITASALFLILAFARSVICKAFHYFWLSKAVTATGSTEVNVSQMLPGDQITVKWRAKPVFIRRRTSEEIERARRDDELVDTMRDPELDSQRHTNPEWLINVAVCTHLGCIPHRGGDYGGYFCPCHGSHYDGSGRIRQGPAPANLEVPPYQFLDDHTIKLG